VGKTPIVGPRPPNKGEEVAGKAAVIEKPGPVCGQLKKRSKGGAILKQEGNHSGSAGGDHAQ